MPQPPIPNHGCTACEMLTELRRREGISRGLNGFLGLEEAAKLPSEAQPPKPEEEAPYRPEPQEPAATKPDAAGESVPETDDTPDFCAYTDKKATFGPVNPYTGEQLPLIKKYGVAGKGCLQRARMKVNEATMRDWPRASDDPNAELKMISMKEFSATLKSENGTGPVPMRLNPIYQSIGREESLFPGREYPKRQEFRQYVLFTIELDTGKTGDPMATVSVGNKLDDPIWMRATLNQPFGEELPLKYELVKDKVALWLWNEQELDFYEISPFTNAPATPVAYVYKDGDETSWATSGSGSRTRATSTPTSGPRLTVPPGKTKDAPFASCAAAHGRTRRRTCASPTAAGALPPSASTGALWAFALPVHSRRTSSGKGFWRSMPPSPRRTCPAWRPPCASSKATC